MRVNMHHHQLEKDMSCDQGTAGTPRDYHWLEKSVPCRHACPAGTDIPGYLAAIAAGDFERAYLINLQDNVFPGVLGRICTRPCEQACRHGFEGLGDAVAICFSKRSSADHNNSAGQHLLPALFPATGKKVVVIGSGPSGLAAARDLCLFGHEVVVYEQYHLAGGMLSQNIPPFRLPRDIVAREIEQIRAQGVEIRCSSSVGLDIPFSDLVDISDALIVAGGCTRPNIPDIEGLDCQGVLHGSDFLLGVIEGKTKIVGRRVAVIGGGFTAVDCARAAVRDGAEEVTVYYRRRREDMTLTPGELEALVEEGIGVELLVSPSSVSAEHGLLQSVEFVRNRSNSDAAGGKAGIEEIEGSAFQVAVDTLLLATGQGPDWDWLEEAAGKGSEWKVDEELLPGTSIEGLFVAGDQGSGSTSVIDAVASGRRCARAVDSYLMGEERVHSVVSVAAGRETVRPFEDNAIPRQEMATLPLDQRSLSGEVEKGYVPDTAVEEARRCYLCNFKYEIDTSRCIFCDLCCEVKPLDDCILKVRSLTLDEGKRILGFGLPDDSFDPENQFVYRINPAACIRCNRCVEACPVNCIAVHRINLEQLHKPATASGESVSP